MKTSSFPYLHIVRAAVGKVAWKGACIAQRSRVFRIGGAASLSYREHGIRARRSPHSWLYEEDIMNVRHLNPRHRERAAPLRESGDPLLNLQRQMDRLWDGVMRQFDRPLFDRPLSRFGLDREGDWPNVELNERDKELVLTAELPGMSERDVEVLHEGDGLLLRGERRDIREDAGRRYSEYYYGRFERRIPIETDVEWEQVKAGFRDGLLTVTLPKTPRAQTAGRRIPISTTEDPQPQ